MSSARLQDKINTQKSVVFLYPSNEQFKNKINKTINLK